MSEKECINILPVVGGGSNTDTATAMAMMNNNPWMYLVMLALFGGGNWGFGNRETLFKLVYKLALNKLCDKDKMFNIREYFKL